MNHDPEAPFTITPPKPSTEAMEAAWTAAACEFHRNLHKQSQNSAPHTLIRWIWPLAAVATIAILCGLLVTRPANVQPTHQSQTQLRPNLTQLYNQGRQLFGDKLEAVTVSKNQVIWHLTDDLTPPHRTDQLITLTLNYQQPSELFIATSPGTPLDVEYQGETHQVEFLPNASNQVMAIGDGIYWDSDQPESPMSELVIQKIHN